jgi:LysM repeat protein
LCWRCWLARLHFTWSAQTITHTVQPGETLSRSRDSTVSTEAELLALNNLDEPDTIHRRPAVDCPDSLATFAPEAP